MKMPQPFRHMGILGPIGFCQAYHRQVAAVFFLQRSEFLQLVVFFRARHRSLLQYFAGLEILEITASSSKDFLTKYQDPNLSLSRYKNATPQNVRSSLQQSFPVLSSPLLPRDQGVLSYVPGGNRTHI
jgi:hypothetical protein